MVCGWNEPAGGFLVSPATLHRPWLRALALFAATVKCGTIGLCIILRRDVSAERLYHTLRRRLGYDSPIHPMQGGLLVS